MKPLKATLWEQACFNDEPKKDIRYWSKSLNESDCHCIVRMVSGFESWASGTRPRAAKSFYLNLSVFSCTYLSRNPQLQWNDF